MRPGTIVAALALAGLPLPAQSGDTTRTDTTRVDSALVTPPAPAAPLPPTPEQQQYLDGLRTAGRGIAQLKSGIDRVQRMQAGRDSLQQRGAARRLGGLCAAARDFLTRGRARMQYAAYEDTTRIKARWLAVQVDTLAKFMSTCEANAGRDPERTVKDLTARMRRYEAALEEFRAAVGLPTTKKGV